MKNLDVLDCIKNRRSCREYLNKDISDSIAKMLIEAAVQAPFGGPPKPKCQVFEAIVVRDINVKTKLALNYEDRQFIKTAPIIIACLANKNNDPKYKEWNTSAALSIQNLLIAAQSQDIGSCILSCFLYSEKHKKDKQILREILGLPQHIELVALVALGYKTNLEVLEEKTLRDFSELVSYEKYGSID